MGCFEGTQERLRNSRGKRVDSIRATEVSTVVLTVSNKLPGKGLGRELKSIYMATTLALDYVVVHMHTSYLIQ